MWPSDQYLTAVFFGQALEAWWFIRHEAVQGAICLGAGKEHTYGVIDKV